MIIKRVPVLILVFAFVVLQFQEVYAIQRGREVHVATQGTPTFSSVMGEVASLLATRTGSSSGQMVRSGYPTSIRSDILSDT